MAAALAVADRCLGGYLAGRVLITALYWLVLSAVQAQQPEPAAASATENDTTQLDALQVTGQEQKNDYVPGPVTIAKGRQRIREIPQSVSVITQQRMEDQNLTTIPEVVKQTTGVTVQRFDGAGLFNSYNARGYQIDTLLLEGLPRDNTGNVTEFDTAIYERIELLKGPAGLFLGAGEPGAMLNLARKRAQARTDVAGTFSLGSWDRYRAQLDVTGALNESGSVRGRFVGLHDEGDSFLDVVNYEKQLVYGTLEFDLTTRTTLSAGVTHQEIDSVIDRGLPAYADGRTFTVNRAT